MNDDDLDGFEKFNASAWFAAIRAADTWRDATLKGAKKIGDLSRLVGLLRSKLTGAYIVMTREELELLIDLLSRHRLKQKPGGRKVPAYKRSSWADLKLEIAVEWVRDLERKGLSRKDAIERVVANAKVEESTLKLYIENRLHAERRPRR